MLGYSTVLVILFLLDCYMIQAHQEKLKAAKWELLNDWRERKRYLGISIHKQSHSITHKK